MPARKSDIASNPLINPPALPQGVPAFDKIKAEHFLPALQLALKKANFEIRQIANNPEKPTFENTIEALEFAGKELSYIAAIFESLALTHGTKQIQDIEDDVNNLITKFENNKIRNEKLFQRVKAVHRSLPKSKLSQEQQALTHTFYQDFCSEGFDLSKAKKKELEQINLDLSSATTKFSQNHTNAAESYKKIVNNVDLLEGLPPRAIENLKDAAKKAGHPGKYLITLDPYPSDILEFCKNRELRKEIMDADYAVATSGKWDNRPLILEIVKLRYRKARLLGFKSYAQMAIAQCMADTLPAVERFVKGNLRKYRNPAEQHFEKIKKFALDRDGITDFSPHDLFYYSRWLQQETFDFDPETLRPYFTVGNVIEGLKKHAEKLFDIEMRETKGVYPVPTPDVKVFEVYDNKTSKILGILYADYFVRPGEKTSGAFAESLRNRHTINGKEAVPIVFNVANFNPPTENQPSHLSLDDVKTAFHEFGHALHVLLGEGKYSSLGGMNVAADFSELPSQLMENWLLEEEVLAGFARHYVTGEKITSDVVRKIRDADNFNTAYRNMRMVSHSLLDLYWHSEKASKFKSVEAVERKIHSLTDLFNRSAPGLISPTFTHLFDDPEGYAATYYSYKWSEVLDKDVFAQFKKAGLYNQDIALRLRRSIFAMGQRRDPMDLFIEFMGRQPDPRAMYRAEGISPA